MEKIEQNINQDNSEKKVELQYKVVEVIDRIGKKVKNSRLTAKALLSVANDTKKIQEFLDVTQIQAVLFCIIFIMNYKGDDSVTISDMAGYLGVSTMAMLSHYKELRGLAGKSIISANDDRCSCNSIEGMGVAFSVDTLVSEAVLENTIPDFFSIKKEKTIFELINFVERNFFDKTPENRVPFRVIKRKFEKAESKFLSLPTAKTLKDILLLDNRILFYDLCYDKINDFNSSLLLTLFDLYNTDDSKVRVILEEFKNGKHQLQRLGFVELLKNDDMKKPEVKVTDKGLEAMLGEQADLYIETIPDKDLIVPSKITAKELFYSEETEKQISLLRSSLSKNKFRQLQARLSKEKMPKGICALFYGYPGTGKTESVYQIAKATRRKVYHVDISGTKSCWFGESEKIIKEVFSKYNDLCKKCRDKKENLPILLFNEADAVFSKRKDANSSNVAQTENAIQNIILEQMESLEGIMIATTNLENNFDSAFERRFLFKIKFEKPTNENRAKIWQNKITSLSEKDALLLAKTYDFSGGEIDNVVRKSLMQNIISGEEISFENIDQLCKTEKLCNESKNVIGFNT